MKDNSMFFSGKKLYGNDFNKKEIQQWFEDEAEGYSSTIEEEYKYKYHEQNKYNGYNFIDKGKIKSALGFGSAFGDEFLPIIKHLKKITIIEPSKKLRAKKIGKIVPEYIMPNPNGEIILPNDSVDLITCLGVLHHIPNVSKIISEFKRVLKKDGYLLIREPIVSMGDWTKTRKGLTKRERGIPEKLFDKIIKKNELIVISKRKIMFPLTRRIENEMNLNPSTLVKLDRALSILFSWNNKYHATKFFHKIRPQSMFYVLKKSL